MFKVQQLYCSIGNLFSKSGKAVLLTEINKLSIYTSTEDSATISEGQTFGRREEMLLNKSNRVDKIGLHED